MIGPKILRHELSRWTLLLAVFLAAGATPPSRAIAGELSETAVASTIQIAQAKPKKFAYRPPMRGAPARRMAGSTRGAGGVDATLNVLAPDHVGLTASAGPSLYWYLSKPVAVRVEVAVISEDAIDPLLEVAFDAGTAGINRVSLADHGIEIAEDTEIEWSVAIVVDPAQRSKDIFTTGALKRVAAESALTEKLASASAEDRIGLYAEHGLWYDAIEAVSKLIDAAPGDARWRELRADFLDQVGLAEAAAFDRNQAQ